MLFTKAPQFLVLGLLGILVLFLTIAGSFISATWFLIIMQDGMPQLVGRRHLSAFDLWSIQHLATGMMIGYLLPRTKMQFRTDESTFMPQAMKVWLYGACVIVPALSWEFFEYFAEAGQFGEVVRSWFGSNHEHSVNRFYTDPMLVYTGAMTASWFPKLKLGVFIFVPSWITINLLMPSSVTIQNSLF